MKRIILILILVLVSFVGCKNKKVEPPSENLKGENEIYYEKKDTEGDVSTIDMGEFIVRYDEVEKDDLKYEFLKNGKIFRKQENGSLKVEGNGSSNSNEKYREILVGYSAVSDVSNTYLFSYGNIEDMIKKVLPDDIILEKTVKVNCHMYQYYKSSKGDFVVDIFFEDEDEFNMDPVDDFSICVGIAYFKKV